MMLTSATERALMPPAVLSPEIGLRLAVPSMMKVVSSARPPRTRMTPFSLDTPACWATTSFRFCRPWWAMPPRRRWWGGPATFVGAGGRGAGAVPLPPRLPPILSRAPLAGRPRPRRPRAARHGLGAVAREVDLQRVRARGHAADQELA